MNRHLWLRCKTEDGIFSDECDVCLATPEGRTIVSTVPRNMVKVIGKNSALRVRIVKVGRKKMAMVPSAQPEIVSFCEKDLLKT